MRYFLLLLSSIFVLSGCAEYRMEKLQSVDSGINIDVFPVTKTVQIKIEKNKDEDAYEKVTSYITSHHNLIFNNEVTLAFSTQGGQKLQTKVVDYLKTQGMNLSNLHYKDSADKEIERFDFKLEVIDYQVQVPLCNQPPKYYEYSNNGCVVESNLWSSKVNPEKSLHNNE